MLVTLGIIALWASGRGIAGRQSGAGLDMPPVPIGSGEVMHVRAERLADGHSPTVEEVWYDEEYGWIAHQQWQRGQLVFHNVEREGVLERYRPGPGERRLETGLRGDQDLPLAGGDLLRYGVLIDRGQWDTSIWSVADSGPQTVVLATERVDNVQRVVWLDRASRLPMREQERYFADGGVTTIAVEWRYALLEWLGRDDVAPCIFETCATELPVVYSVLTVEQARSLVGLPVYYLGEHFANMVPRISYQHDPRPDGHTFLWVVYETEGRATRVSLTERPSSEYTQRTFGGFPVTGAAMVIAGRPVTAYSRSLPTTESWELVIGETTWVTIFGSTAELRKRAVQALQPLNALAEAAPDG